MFAAGSAAVGSFLAQRCPARSPRGNVWTSNVRMEREGEGYAENFIETIAIQESIIAWEAYCSRILSWE